MNCCARVSGNACHCARCHQTFSGLALFDAHQVVRYNTPQPVSCRPPEAMGLLLDGSVWRTREGLLAMTEKVARMATIKARRAA